MLQAHDEMNLHPGNGKKRGPTESRALHHLPSHEKMLMLMPMQRCECPSNQLTMGISQTPDDQLNALTKS
jgi:hypothetical protein